MSHSPCGENSVKEQSKEKLGESEISDNHLFFVSADLPPEVLTLPADFCALGMGRALGKDSFCAIFPKNLFLRNTQAGVYGSSTEHPHATPRPACFWLQSGLNACGRMKDNI